MSDFYIIFVLCFASLLIGTILGVFLSPKIFKDKFSNMFRDSAKEVLEECIRNITSKKLNNVSTFLGNLKEFKFQTTKADLISLNMVLHHNINPQNVLKECSAVLAENGFMLITELCNHNQEWTKTSCGDLWYGFEPETIEKWAKECKLKKMESMFIAQSNPFQWV